MLAIEDDANMRLTIYGDKIWTFLVTPSLFFIAHHLGHLLWVPLTAVARQPVLCSCHHRVPCFSCNLCLPFSPGFLWTLPGIHACAAWKLWKCQHFMKQSSEREQEFMVQCFPFSSLSLKILVWVIHSFLGGPHQRRDGSHGHFLSLLPCPRLFSTGSTLQNSLPLQTSLS